LCGAVASGGQQKRSRRIPAVSESVGGEAAVGAEEAAFPPLPAIVPRRIMEISVDADAQYYRAFGNATVAQMEATLNTIDALYSEQLGIRLRPRSYHVFTSSRQPYRSNTAYGLLSEFQSYSVTARPMTRADVYHLFSGKTLQSSIIGLGYVGEICQDSGRFAFSLSQRFIPAVHALVAAHELGHNLGAHHPEEVLELPPPRSLMTGVVQPGNDALSEFSRGEIAQYVSRHGRCLAKAADERP